MQMTRKTRQAERRDSRAAIDSARECFSTIPDPRRRQGKRFSLPDVLLIALMAILCGADSAEDMEEWADLHREWLEPWFNLKHGTPSQDTFLRVFEMIRPDMFADAVQQWLAMLRPKLAGHIAIDGKTLRRSVDNTSVLPALHVVSAWLRDAGLVVGQVRTEDKSNEIRAIPELLELLDIEGCIISIDAGGCHRAIAEKIVDGRGNYLFAVKGNQPTLEQDIEKLFEEAQDNHRRSVDELEQPTVDQSTSTDAGHGRLEERRAVVSTDLGWLTTREEWSGLSAVGMIESRRTHSTTGKVEEGRRYFISSDASMTATRLLELTRGHWSVENNLHWVLDVEFGEDRCRARGRRGADNLSRLRRMALSMLKGTPPPRKKRMSIKAQRRYCDHRLDYLTQVLSSDAA